MTIQYGYRKCGTPTRGFSRTLAHGNSKNGTNKDTEEEGKMRPVNMESTAGTKKKDLTT